METSPHVRPDGYSRLQERSHNNLIVQQLPDRSGCRCATQQAANLGWDLYHMDLKTTFLQGEAYDETRDINCEIPKECGYPPHMGARMKQSAYGFNDAPRRWWQVVDKALLCHGLVPTRADRCTYILYGDQKTSNAMTKKNPQKNLNLEDALELLLNASVRNISQENLKDSFVYMWMIFLWPEVLRLKNVYYPKFVKTSMEEVKSHDKHGAFTSCDQKLAVDQLEENKVDKQG